MSESEVRRRKGDGGPQGDTGVSESETDKMPREIQELTTINVGDNFKLNQFIKMKNFDKFSTFDVSGKKVEFLTKKQKLRNLKGTVGVISSDTPCKDSNV